MSVSVDFQAKPPVIGSKQFVPAIVSDRDAPWREKNSSVSGTGDPPEEGAFATVRTEARDGCRHRGKFLAYEGVEHRVLSQGGDPLGSELGKKSAQDEHRVVVTGPVGLEECEVSGELALQFKPSLLDNGLAVNNDHEVRGDECQQIAESLQVQVRCCRSQVMSVVGMIVGSRQGFHLGADVMREGVPAQLHFYDNPCAVSAVDDREIGTPLLTLIGDDKRFEVDDPEGGKGLLELALGDSLELTLVGIEDFLIDAAIPKQDGHPTRPVFQRIRATP